jgi:hypothetical protein
MLNSVRLQGPPFPDVEKEQLELSSYHLKIRMWLCRFAVMQEDPEEDKERRNTIVSFNMRSVRKVSDLFFFLRQPGGFQ